MAFTYQCRLLRCEMRDCFSKPTDDHVDITWQFFSSCVIFKHTNEMLLAEVTTLWLHKLSVISVVEIQQLCSWSWHCPHLHVMIQDFKKCYILMFIIVRNLFCFTKNICLWKLFCETQKIFVHFLQLYTCSSE